MNIERIKVEVQFCELEEFEPFEYNREIYFKLPELRCRVNAYIGNGLNKEVTGDFNAVGLSGRVRGDYEYVNVDTTVRPLKAELKIYE